MKRIVLLSCMSILALFLVSPLAAKSPISFTDNDDDLGTFVVQYINPVVLQSAMSALKIKSYDTGKIKVTIMPMLD